MTRDGEAVTLLAPAKLTLSLRVTGVRDDGYHLIDAEMVTISLADRLTFRAGDGLEIHGPASAGVGAGPDNLVARALAGVGRTAHVEVEKHIPAGGGLGGGSADAAAVFRWAGRTNALDEAVRLGADVPFCISGGRARVRGVGEILEPLPFEEMTFTLATPAIHCDTAAVYRAWDDLGGPSGPGENDLEAAAIAVQPDLAQVRDELESVSGQRPSLAGSGSTWFVRGEYPGAGRSVVQTVPAH